MIAKIIRAPKGGSGFRRLGAYVLNAKGGADPASWTRLGAYVLDAERDGEKVAWSRATNCTSTDPGWAVKEIIVTQAQNKLAKADKGIHLVVSFPEGERPTREQTERIEDRLCACMGLGDHQRVSAVHQNTDNWHLHVAINRIHPTTFHAIHPFRDRYRLQATCMELETELGLTQTRHSRNAAEVARNSGPGRQSGRPAGELTREALEARMARDEALKALRIQQADYRRRLDAYHAERWRKEKALGTRGDLRVEAFRHLAERRKADRAERQAREAAERKALLARYPLAAPPAQQKRTRTENDMER